MRIVQLTAENFKRLSAVEITPAGDLVQITGKNGAGKSSVLDAIWAALGGAKHIQSAPIRKGYVTARIRLDLGELVVQRRFTEAGSSLTVESATGSQFRSPQTVLDALLGALTFDPLAFATMEPRKQFDTLRSIVPLDVDVDELDGKNRTDYERRAELNREARRLRAQADGVPLAAGLPDAPVDVSALKDRVADAARVNAEIEREKASRNADDAQIRSERSRMEQDIEEAKRLEAAASDAFRRADKIKRDIAAAEALVRERQPLPTPVDVSALLRDLDAAESVNRGIEQRERATALITEARRAEHDAAILTQTMEAREQEKRAAIQRAQMPVEGLSFGDGAVTFKDLPFEQASSAERLRVSVGIAMAANPELRIIRIQEGSLLDADNLALLGEMATERDYQIWVERVDMSGKVGVVIEDGRVKDSEGSR